MLRIAHGVREVGDVVRRDDAHDVDGPEPGQRAVEVPLDRGERALTVRETPARVVRRGAAVQAQRDVDPMLREEVHHLGGEERSVRDGDE